MTQADHFKSHCTVQAFLPRAINHTLAATADFLQQLVVAKVGQCLRGTRSRFSMWRSIRITRFDIFSRAAVIAIGYRWSHEQTKACLK
jgi:hypothetical protein